jgi:hypothetical protein
MRGKTKKLKLAGRKVKALRLGSQNWEAETQTRQSDGSAEPRNDGSFHFTSFSKCCSGIGNNDVVSLRWYITEEKETGDWG